MEKNSSTAEITGGQLDTMVKNIMKQVGISDPKEVVRLINSGGMQISVTEPKFIEKDGVIHFSVVSDGTTGDQWISYLKSLNYSFAKDSKKMLRSKNFKSTNGETYKIAILKKELFMNNELDINQEEVVIKNIRQDAENRKLTTPKNAIEIICLILEKFSRKELNAMGLEAIVVDGDPIILISMGEDHLGEDHFWLTTLAEDFDYRWWKFNRGFGVAYIENETKS